jgi:hypothetical protein
MLPQVAHSQHPVHILRACAAVSWCAHAARGAQGGAARLVDGHNHEVAIQDGVAQLLLAGPPRHRLVRVVPVVRVQLVVKERVVEVHAWLLGVQPKLALLQQAQVEVDELCMRAGRARVSRPYSG